MGMDPGPYHKHISFIWPKPHFYRGRRPERSHKHSPEKAHFSYCWLVLAITKPLPHVPSAPQKPPFTIISQEHPNKLLQSRIPSSIQPGSLLVEELNSSPLCAAGATAGSHNTSFHGNKAGLGAQIQHTWAAQSVKPTCFSPCTCGTKAKQLLGPFPSLPFPFWGTVASVCCVG